MSKVDTNAAAETTAAAVATPAPKAPSKMELARPIFQEVRAADYVLPEGKTARSEFIRRAQAEAGLTDKGAATYWQNLTKEANGEPLYGKAKTKTEEKQVEQAADDANSAADAEAGSETETTASTEQVAAEAVA